MIKTLTYNGEALAKVFVADTFLKRFMGYMFLKKPHHQIILFNHCNSIHTFFMNFPIDVLFVDENMKVIKKVESLGRGKIIMPIKGAKMVIEGKARLFEKIALGCKIEIIGE